MRKERFIVDYLQAKAKLEDKYPYLLFVAVTFYRNLYVFTARNKVAEPDPRTGLYWVFNYTIDKNTGEEVNFSVYGLSDKENEEFDKSSYIEFN